MPRSNFVRATHVPALKRHEWNDAHFCVVENPNGRSKNGKRHVVYVTDDDPMACSYCGKMSVFSKPCTEKVVQEESLPRG